MILTQIVRATKDILDRCMTRGTAVHGILIDSVVTIGESPLKIMRFLFGKYGERGHVDSTRLLLNNRNYTNHNSEEHFMVRLLST